MSKQSPPNSPLFSCDYSEIRENIEHLYEDGKSQNDDLPELNIMNNSHENKETNSVNKNIVNTIQTKSNSNSNTRENTKIRFICKKRGRISNDKKNKIKEIKCKKDKYHKDNLICKVKAAIFEAIRKFINKKIKKCMIGDFEIKKINSYQVKNGNVGFNRKLMKKKIKKIFSVEISNIYKYKSNGNGDYNIDFIKKIYEYKYRLLINIFDKSFLQCLHICRGFKYNEYYTEKYSVKIKQMESLKTIFEKIINGKLKCEDDLYKKELVSTIDNLEIIFFKDKKKRKCRVKEKKKEEEEEEDEDED